MCNPIDKTKLNLDMSFNRKPEGRFACDIDPLSQDFFNKSSIQTTPPPTFQDFEPNQSELFKSLLGWKFPIRTDCARGLIWGPYKHCRGNSWSSDLDESSSYSHSNQSYSNFNFTHHQQYPCDHHLTNLPVIQHLPETTETTTHLSETIPVQQQKQQQQQQTNQQQQPQPQQYQHHPSSVRLQKIFPILRSPLVIRIKPLSQKSTSTTKSQKPPKRRRQSSQTNSSQSSITSPRLLHFGLPTPHHKKHKLIQVAFSNF